MIFLSILSIVGDFVIAIISFNFNSFRDVLRDGTPIARLKIFLIKVE